MEHCLGDHKDNFAIPYLNGLLIFSKTFEEHLNHIKLAPQRLKKQGIKSKPSNMISSNEKPHTMKGLFLQKGTL